MCGSLHKIIMRMGQHDSKRNNKVERNKMIKWKQWRNVRGTLCDSHNGENRRLATEGWLIDEEDTFAWNLIDTYTKEISIRTWVKNYENGSSVTQKETVKWSADLEITEICYKILV